MARWAKGSKPSGSIQWKPGQSGNPAGRPGPRVSIAEIRKWAIEFMPECIRKAAEFLESDKGSDRQWAITYFSDRVGFVVCKPEEETLPPVQEIPRAEIEKALADLEAAKAN